MGGNNGANPHFDDWGSKALTAIVRAVGNAGTPVPAAECRSVRILQVEGYVLELVLSRLRRQREARETRGRGEGSGHQDIWEPLTMQHVALPEHTVELHCRDPAAS